MFFWVAHDPTQKNAQWPDTGPQYRSAIFYASERQQELAKAYISQLQTPHVFQGPIATELVPLSKFYDAEDYHQDYAVKHPQDRVYRPDRSAEAGGSAQAAPAVIREVASDARRSQLRPAGEGEPRRRLVTFNSESGK